MQLAHAYSVNHRRNGAGRIYITFRSLFNISGLLEAGRYSVDHLDGSIEIRPSIIGSQKLMDTGRGPLVELKNIATAKAINYATKVLVIAKKGIIKIIPHPAEALRIQRENRFVNKILNGTPLDSGSLYSGLGLLNLRLKSGLNKAGIKSRIKFANDICPIALSINLETNPIWSDASNNAIAVSDDIRNLTFQRAPNLDMVDVSYPCNGMSTLVDKELRDIKHPIVGGLFIPTIENLKKMNAAVIIIECTPAFNNSDTLNLLQRELHGYSWAKTTINGFDHGEIEKRERACVLAISSGLVDSDSFHLSVSPSNTDRPTLAEFMEPETVQPESWKTFCHVIKKANDDRLSFKHRAYQPTDTSISTLVATYAFPKVGSPFIVNPDNPTLMRMVQTSEHSNIRRVPSKMKDAIQAIADGTTQYTTKRGSKSLAHRLLGMSVSKLPWEAAGECIGHIINNLVFQKSFLA